MTYKIKGTQMLKQTIRPFMYYIGIALIAAVISITVHACEKTLEAQPSNSNSGGNFAVVGCDSLCRVIWGDTLRVVPRTISTGIVRKGPYAGKRYWQAMLSSNNFIEPTNFLNDPIRHRVVVADTTLITEADVFIISRKR